MGVNRRGEAHLLGWKRVGEGLGWPRGKGVVRRVADEEGKVREEEPGNKKIEKVREEIRNN